MGICRFPSLTDEQLARLRPIQEYDPELLARILKATEELKKIAHPRPARMTKPWPTLPDDKVAEDFVDDADLSEYDWNAAEPVSYEFKKKSSALNMRIPQSLLDAIKTKAKARGMPFTRYVRILIEQDLARP